MDLFENIFLTIETFFRQLTSAQLGGIILGVLLTSLVLFLFSAKGAKKEKFVKNYFLFILSIIFAGIGLFLTIYLG